ncbi:hypothetical protein LIER_43988 [Lithospermum erythrorhizon]|uniref:BRCT domain-containing protein n=1 Tax=Lithospermum erythrorhizon TaxID=34254 RepID=A0AAV3RGL2_LITER
MGAICVNDFDESVTHVVSDDPWTEIFREKWLGDRPLVKSDWILGSNLLWRKEPEDQFHPGGSERDSGAS